MMPTRIRTDYKIIEDMFQKEGGKYYYKFVSFPLEDEDWEAQNEVCLDGWFNVEQLRLLADTLENK